MIHVLAYLALGGLVQGPLFDFDPKDYSQRTLASRIGPSLTLNSITVSTPDWEYDGTNGTASAWTATYGPNLTKVEVGANITAGQDTPLMSSDTGVLYADADYHQESSASWAIGTKDVVFYAVFRTGAQGGTDTIFSNFASNTGLELTDAAGTLRVTFGDGTGSVNIDSAGATAYTWYSMACYLRRAGSGVCYYQGAVGTAAAISARSASLAATNKLTLGAKPDGTNPGDCILLYAAAWTSASWLDTHLQANDGMSFAQKVEGVWPVISQGSAVATTKTRASNALLKKYTSGVVSYFNVGSTWARVQSDAATTGYTTGLSRTNVCYNSEDLTAFTKLNAGDSFSADSVADPYIDGSSKMDGLIGQAANVEHGVTQIVNGGSNLAAAVYVQSAVYKAGRQSFAKVCNDTIANGCSFFNISTCATSATSGAGVSSRGVESLGNSLCRVWIKWTGTVAAHTVRFSCAEADNDATVAGDGTNPECSIWGMEVDASGGDSPDAPIVTGAATGNKAAEQLKFTATGNANTAGAGSLVCQYEFPTSTLATATALFAADDGTVNNRVQVGTPGTTSVQSSVVTAASVLQTNISGSTANATGAVIVGATDFQTNRVVNYVAGAIDGAVDTTASMPTTTAVNIGSVAGLGQASSALIARCQIWQSPEHAVIR